MHRKPLHTPAKRWLILPVETKVREWDGKILLALEAVERGWGVVIGRAIRKKPFLPLGIFIENSISPGRKKDLDYSLEQGRKVCAWCEEGVVYFDAQDYERRRVEIDSYNMLEYYFAWGQHLARDMTGPIGCNPEKMAATGNPRFDILRADYREILRYRTQKIIKKYGRYVLVNTKFARYNNYFGTEGFIKKLKEGRKVNNTDQESFERGLIDFQGNVFHKFMEAIPFLAEQHPDINFIIRPHPVENIDPWLDLARKHANVFVEKGGNVAEWILGCLFCLHNNCTTAVESFLMEKLAISYNPYDDMTYDTELPRALSHNVRTLEELVSMVDRSLKALESHTTEHQIKIAQDYISGQTGPTSSHRIMDYLDKVDIPIQQGLFQEITYLGSLIYRMLDFLRHLKNRFATPQQLIDMRYVKQKFDRVDKKEVAEFLIEAQKVTGRYQHINIYEIDPSCFCLYKH